MYKLTFILIAMTGLYQHLLEQQHRDMEEVESEEKLVLPHDIDYHKYVWAFVSHGMVIILHIYVHI